MSGETWTEYGVMWAAGVVAAADREHAGEVAAKVAGTLVGRTVTASPWLPVEDQP